MIRVGFDFLGCHLDDCGFLFLLVGRVTLYPLDGLGSSKSLG